MTLLHLAALLPLCKILSSCVSTLTVLTCLNILRKCGGRVPSLTSYTTETQSLPSDLFDNFSLWMQPTHDLEMPS